MLEDIPLFVRLSESKEYWKAIVVLIQNQLKEIEKKEMKGKPGFIGRKKSHFILY